MSRWTLLMTTLTLVLRAAAIVLPLAVLLAITLHAATRRAR